MVPARQHAAYGGRRDLFLQQGDLVLAVVDFAGKARSVALLAAQLRETLEDAVAQGSQGLRL